MTIEFDEDDDGLDYAQCDSIASGGACRLNIIESIPLADMIKTFGKGEDEPTMDDRTHNEWTFTDRKEAVFTIYDYCDEKWHIGGFPDRGDVTNFINWVHERVETVIG